MNSRQSEWEEQFGSLAVTVFLTIIVAAIVIIAVIVYVTLTQGWRIYRDRALNPHSPVRKFLWLALAGFGVALLLALILMLFPSTFALGIYLATWSFLIFVVAIVCADLYAAVQEPKPTEFGIEDILQPWDYESPRRSA